LRSQANPLAPVFLAGWSCLAVAAVWQVHVQKSDSILALSGGVLLLASLVLSRCVLGLRVMTGPMLYLVLLGLFHFGLVVPWAFGIYDIGRVAWFNPHGLSRAIGLVTYSIVTYQLGAFVAFSTGTRSGGSAEVGDRDLDDSRVFAAGCFLFVVAVGMFIAGLIRLDPSGYYRLTYSETFRLRAESDPRFFGSGITVASIGLCLAVAGASKRQIWAAFLCVSVWVFALFYLGFRGPALVAGLVVYAVSLKKRMIFPKWFPLLAAAILLIAVPIERIAREEPLDERSFSTTIHEINLLDAPAEMGTSIRPLAETADLIDATNYRYGRTYLAGLKGVFPNLALRWEAPTTETIDDLPPSHWITAVTDPWSYQNYGGMGFSAVAEPYMNFGTGGVLIYFAVLAFFLVRLEQVSIRSSYGLATWGLVLGPLLWTTRNDFSSFFRPVVWGLLCLGLLRISYSLASRTGQREPTAGKPRMHEVRQV
jgi:oligosaccharide repeat unit polymerase